VIGGLRTRPLQRGVGRAIEELDLWLRDPRNTANPGTTADLTASAIFVVLLGGGWRLGPA
jgi:triphosphoribosyl-dephospho-CoA synthetase